MEFYNEAEKVQQLLINFINECVANNEIIKSCIKAKRAIVTTVPNPATQLVGIKLIGDNTEIFLPYNSTFTPSDLSVNKIVSVWYNYSLNNGIVMKNSTWTN